MYRQVNDYVQSGFTLIELMIVIAIAGVLAAVALPSYDAVVKNNCLLTKSTSLVTSLHLARSEAIKRGRGVRVVPASVHTNNFANNEWGEGWTVVASGVDRVFGNTDDMMISTVDLGCPNTFMDEANTTVTTVLPSYVYFPTGFVDAPGSVAMCDDRTGEQGRVVTINVTGRPNVSTMACP